MDVNALVKTLAHRLAEVKAKKVRTTRPFAGLVTAQQICCHACKDKDQDN